MGHVEWSQRTQRRKRSLALSFTLVGKCLLANKAPVVSEYEHFTLTWKPKGQGNMKHRGHVLGYLQGLALRENMARPWLGSAHPVPLLPCPHKCNAGPRLPLWLLASTGHSYTSAPREVPHTASASVLTASKAWIDPAQPWRTGMARIPGAACLPRGSTHPKPYLEQLKPPPSPGGRCRGEDRKWSDLIPLFCCCSLTSSLILGSHARDWMPPQAPLAQ